VSLTVNQLITSVPSSQLPSSDNLKIKLEEIDPYSLESLQEIKDQRLANFLEFSIVVIKELNHLYFVEASSFLEQYLRGNIRNPLTNNNLDDFEIFTYDSVEKLFKFRSDKTGIQNPLLYLHILYNDHKRDLGSRLDYLHRLGCLSLKENPQQGYDYLAQAAQMGFSPSQRIFALILCRENKKEAGIYWFKKYLEKDSASPSDLIFLATQVRDTDCMEAFSLFDKAARKGNYLAIANVIDCYEKGKGTDRDLTKASAWRSKLPLDFQKSPMIDFISYLEQIKYNLDSES
jgi:penicillin-binding protein-related factor A (putative recombinase)